MKILKSFLLFVSILLVISCSKSDQIIICPDCPKYLEQYPLMVGIPFKVNINYVYHDYYENENLCGVFPVLSFAIEGSGQINNLGTLTTYIEFCGNIETLAIGDVRAIFVDSNGNKLYYNILGQVRYRNECDPPGIMDVLDARFIFMGGTGRFDGARGEGVFHGCNIYYAYNLINNPVESSYAIYEGMLFLDINNQ